MKDKIMFLIMGILIGAIIATAGFWIYSKNVKSNNQPEMMQMNGNSQMGNPPSGGMGEPPAKPDGDNGSEPSTKPEETNQNSNS